MKSIRLQQQILIALTSLCVLFGSASTVQAQEVSADKAAQIRTTIERNTKGKVKIGGVHLTPIDGIFQVENGTEVFYVDASGRYAFSGAALIDMVNSVDLTAAPTEKLRQINFADLPLQHAVKEVRGNGARKFAIFEDPKCPVCRSFAKFADQLTNVTVYRFMLPIISADSTPLTQAAWCSTDDKGRAWRALMAGQRPMGGIKKDCDTRGLVEIMKIAERFNIVNTPTIVLANGKRMIGAAANEEFIAELDRASR